MKHIFRQTAFVLFSFCAFVLLLSFTTAHVAASPQGAVIQVTTTVDEFDTSGSGAGCSLREAIQAANTDQPFGGCAKGDGADVIQLQAATYTLSRSGANEDTNTFGDLDIQSSLTLQGQNATVTILGGGNLDRVLHVHANFVVQITNMTIRDGKATGHGGGIYNDGILTITNSTLSNNQADYQGGAIFNARTLTLDHVTLHTNQALYGGGLSVYTNAQATLIASTLRENTSTLSGGGIYHRGSDLTITTSTLSKNVTHEWGGGLYTESKTTITNSTLSGNTADGIGGGIAASTGANLALSSVTIANNSANRDDSGTERGGGMYIAGGTGVLVRNTLLANNKRGFVLPVADDCNGSFYSLGNNLIRTPGGCTIANDDASNLKNVNPQLGALADNGGPTKTHALAANSPALDQGDAQGCRDTQNHTLAQDQRGNPRSVDGDGNGSARCDIGAFEYNPAPPPPTPVPTATPPPAGCTAKPAQPTLTLPTNGAALTQAKVTLKWNDVGCETKYRVRVKNAATNVIVFKKNIGADATLVKTGALDKAKTYKWFVKACNNFGCNKSAVQQFTLQ